MGVSRLSRSNILHYGCAVVSTVLATLVRLLLDPVLGDQFPFATLFFAVLLTAWYGGSRPALSAVILGAISADYFLLPPRGNFVLHGEAEYFGMAIFVGVGLGLALVGGAMHDAPLGSIRKLRQTQDALVETEERLRLTLRATGIGVWTWNANAGIVEATS